MVVVIPQRCNGAVDEIGGSDESEKSALDLRRTTRLVLWPFQPAEPAN